MNPLLAGSGPSALPAEGSGRHDWSQTPNCHHRAVGDLDLSPSCWERPQPIRRLLCCPSGLVSPQRAVRLHSLRLELEPRLDSAAGPYAASAPKTIRTHYGPACHLLIVPFWKAAPETSRPWVPGCTVQISGQADRAERMGLTGSKGRLSALETRAVSLSRMRQDRYRRVISHGQFHVACVSAPQ